MDVLDETDVVICGSGSAGLCAAMWLARCGIKCRILEKRDGPLEVGQADGVQCRTVEVFESFGLAEYLLKEAYHVIELAFWVPDGHGGIQRNSRAADTEPGLSHQPHLILSQARVNNMMLQAIEKYKSQKVDYGYEVTEVYIDDTTHQDPNAHCVTVVAHKDSRMVSFRAKYVLVCDGAHSAARRSLGFKMIGDSSDSVWGVMDVFARTNFPDIRRKCTIRSDHGVIVLIPRENKYVVRLYIELKEGTQKKDVKLEDLYDIAARIFSPFIFDPARTLWWSAYSVGQRHADFFAKHNRVFLAGDACHTHSPKAGQGMNVSLQDGYNIGWKLVSVLRGVCSPELLETYVLERRKVAVDLIEFDRNWAKMFSSGGEIGPDEFTDRFLKAGRYTAGLTAKYDSSIITSEGSLGHLQVGMRLQSAQVVRFCDAKAMQLIEAFPADGRWRILVFGGTDMTRLQTLADYFEQLAEEFSYGGPIDSFFETILLLYGDRMQITLEQLPYYYWPASGPLKMRDFHKVFVDDKSYHSGHGQAYSCYGVNPTYGALAVIRPDHHIAIVSMCDDYKSIGKFFKGFTIKNPKSSPEDTVSNL